MSDPVSIPASSDADQAALETACDAARQSAFRLANVMLSGCAPNTVEFVGQLHDRGWSLGVEVVADRNGQQHVALILADYTGGKRKQVRVVADVTEGRPRAAALQ